MANRYAVSDGKLVLIIEPAEEGGYIVTSSRRPARCPGEPPESGAIVGATACNP
jgi:hypothetical protein